MNILQSIVANTKVKLIHKKEELSLKQIKSSLEDLDLPRGRFKDNISNKDEAIIAEIKKASPSAGVIVEEFDPVKKAIEYEAFGASALSILTEEDFFMGSNEYLKIVKRNTALPILRKDFMIDPYQIYETKASGGDCILLIVAALDLVQLKDFSQLAEELNLDVLIEVHSEDELNTALSIDPRLVGINNRDLTTFEVDKNLAKKLAKQISKDVIVVSESGINSREDILSSKEEGIHSFLIGESLMREQSPGKALRDILGK